MKILDTDDTVDRRFLVIKSLIFESQLTDQHQSGKLSGTEIHKSS